MLHECVTVYLAKSTIHGSSLFIVLHLCPDILLTTRSLFHSHAKHQAKFQFSKLARFFNLCILKWDGGMRNILNLMAAVVSLFIC
jgi:hypothetical protein